MAMENDKPTLSPAQAAEFLGKSRQSVISLIKAGELEYTDERTPESSRPYYRITRDSLMRWKRSRQGTMKRVLSPRATVSVTGLLSRMRESKRLRQAHGRGQD